MNLLEETVLILEEHNLTPKDVLWVGNTEVRTDWDNFAQIANVEYDYGYGSQEVAFDLLIVGKDWWLERHEYGGAENWEFKKLLKKPKRKVTLTKVMARDGSWNSLSKLNPEI
jgi:hypothetical protein